MPLKTKDILDVEIAKTGTFNASTGKVTFTRKDFNDMEAASKELLGKVAFPLKLGHNEGQELVQEDGLPAAGWIENVRREGDLLKADFMRVPLQIAELMKAGAFRKRSIEAFRNVEFAGKRFPMVLTGTALLGEDLPAVDSLDDIEALYQAAKLELPVQDQDTEATLVLMTVGVDATGGGDNPDTETVAEIIRELQALVGRAESLIKNRKGAPQLRSLVKTVTNELRQVTKTTIGDGDMELSREQIVKMLGLADDVTDDDMEAAIKELQETQAAKKKDQEEADRKAKAEANMDPAIKELQDENAKQAAQILTLENDKAKEDATVAADAAIKAGRFVPGVRDQLVQLALTNGEEFKKLVDNTPVNAILATGAVIGGDGDDAPDLSEFEPSANQVVFLEQTGVSREEYILQRIDETGAKVAGPVMAKLRETVKASRG